MDINNIKTNEVFLWKKYDYDEIILSIKLSVLNHVLHIGQFEDYQVTFFDVENLTIEENIHDLDYYILIGSFNLECILIDPYSQLYYEVLKGWINKTKDFSFFKKLSNPFIINDFLIYRKNDEYHVLKGFHVRRKQFKSFETMLKTLEINEIKDLKTDLSAQEILEFLESIK